MTYDQSIQEYKLYLEMIEKNTERRIKSNSFFITIITAIISFSSFIVTNSSLSQQKDIVMSFLIVFLLLLCKIWVNTLDSYKKLNTAKFEVILEIEKNLKHCCLEKEWKLLEVDKKYNKLSKNEKFVPYTIMIFSTLMLLFYLFKN